jgi:WD40 repeat protein
VIARRQHYRAHSLALTPDAGALISGSIYELTLHDPETLEPRRELLNGGARLNGMALLADGRTLAGGCSQGLRVWDLAADRELTPHGRQYTAGVQQVFYGAGGELISVDRAGQVSFWDDSGQLRAACRLPLPMDEARLQAGLPEDMDLYLASREELVELGLDANLAVAFETLEDSTLAWSCEGQGAALGSDAVWVAALSYWESEQGLGLGLHRIDPAGHYLGRVSWPVEAPVWAAGISPDGGRVAAVTAEGTRVFALPSLAPATDATLPNGDLPTFSADGSRLALKTGGAEVTVFEVKTGAVLATVGAGGPARDLCIGWGFSEEDLEPMEWVGMDEANAADTPESVVGIRLTRDGRTALLAHTEGGASAWDVDSGERLWRSDQGYGVAISRDGLAVLLKGADGDAEEAEDRVAVARRLDLRSGEQVGPILLSESDGAGVWCAALSPDGRRLAGGSVDGYYGGGSVLIWDLPPR